MTRVKKIGITALISFLSVLLLFFFVLLNFPYGAVIKRLDTYLAREHGAHLSVGSIRYRYPFGISLRDLRISGREGTFAIKVNDVKLRFRLLTFSKYKTVELGSGGVQLRSYYADSSRSKASIISRIRIPPDFGDPGALPVEYLSLNLQGTDVQRVYISGFELSAFKIPVVELELEREDQYLTVKRGTVKSELFSSEVSGKMNLSSLDLSIGIQMSGDFFRQYPDLTMLFNQVGRNGSLKIRVQGSAQAPVMKIVQ